jgi:L-ribulose-5-phosphate 4-epimerase
MSKEQIERSYEAETGVSIVEAFEGKEPMHTPAVLVAHHGPFTWGKNAAAAVQNSVVLEQVAKMASISVALNPQIEMNQNLIEKHYNRKHGANAYYGQALK